MIWKIGHIYSIYDNKYKLVEGEKCHLCCFNNKPECDDIHLMYGDCSHKGHFINKYRDLSELIKSIIPTKKKTPPHIGLASHLRVFKGTIDNELVLDILSFAKQLDMELISTSGNIENVLYEIVEKF